MPIKISYKKIFVIGAALFIIFAPVGMGMKVYQAVAQTASSTAPAATIGAGAGQSQATSQSPNWFACTMSPASCAVYYVSLFVNGVMALFITLGAWLVELGLQFNDNIFNAPAVLTGFSVSLAIANLGFVLGIIIIAIATIIRNQTYGMKQLLWKLVVMAILVNFGLVITAPIVGFANNMSNYFINATSPSTTTGGYANYVLALTGAFNPQTTISPPTTATGAWTSVCESSASSPIFGSTGLYLLCKATGTQTENPADNFWQNNMAMIFDIVFSAIAVFVFFCLAILLIIRYLMLGGLLIVLPLAWLTYIFPQFSSNFSKWWNTFIKWTFFPPLALFFIYLAFTTAVTTNTATNNAANDYVVRATGGDTNIDIQNSLATQTGLVGKKEGIFAQAADEVLLAGLMIMGLLFASSLAGKAGGVAVSMGTSASKAVGGYIGKRGKRVAGRMVPQKVKEDLQAGKYGFAPKRLQVAAGVGLGNLERAGRGDMVAEEAKNAEALAKDPQQFARILGSKAGSFGTGAVSKQRQMAMLAQLAKDEDLQKEVKKQGNMVGGKDLQEYLRDNEGEFTRLQQGKLYETLKDKSGLTPLKIAQDNEGPQATVLRLGKKNELAEIQGLLQSANDPETAGAFTKEQNDKLAAYKKRKQNFEYAANTGEITEPEKNELNEMRQMETTRGNYMSAGEKEQYQKAQDEFNENNNKLRTWVSKNPDVAADSFQDHDKARAKLTADHKPIPLTFSPENVKQLQQSILTAMAEGFSPQNAKGLIEAVGKNNNLKYFEGAMEKMDAKTVAQIRGLAAANKPLKAWIANNPGAATVVDLNQMFGIAKIKKSKRDKDVRP